jgi:hypothetical protein
MRALIRMTLVDDAPLAGYGLVADAIVSGDADSIRERPFINLRFGDDNPGLGPVTRRNLVVWVHDEPDDYTRIDAIHKRIRAVLEALNGSTSDGGYVMQLHWRTSSSDLSDADRGTILRTATYEIVGR